MESWFSTRSDDDQSILAPLNLLEPITPKTGAAAARISRHAKSTSAKGRCCYEQESEGSLLERSRTFLKGISRLLSQHLETAFAKVNHLRLELVV